MTNSHQTPIFMFSQEEMFYNEGAETEELPGLSLLKFWAIRCSIPVVHIIPLCFQGGNHVIVFLQHNGFHLPFIAHVTCIDADAIQLGYWSCHFLRGEALIPLWPSSGASVVSTLSITLGLFFAAVQIYLFWSVLLTPTKRCFHLFEVDAPHLSPAGLVSCKLTHDQKTLKFYWWHQIWSQILNCWVFLFLASLFPADGRIEENVFAPNPLTSHLCPSTKELTEERNHCPTPLKQKTKKPCNSKIKPTKRNRPKKPTQQKKPLHTTKQHQSQQRIQKDLQQTKPKAKRQIINLGRVQCPYSTQIV